MVKSKTNHPCDFGLEFSGIHDSHEVRNKGFRPLHGDSGGNWWEIKDGSFYLIRAFSPSVWRIERYPILPSYQVFHTQTWNLGCMIG